MSSQAYVVAVKGAVFVIEKNGTKRALHLGDVVNVNEVIVTENGGTIDLQMADGRHMPIGDQEVVRMTQELADNVPPVAGDSFLEAFSVSTVLKAIAEGRDIGDVMEATAAGGSIPTSSYGNSFVNLLPILVDVTPIVYNYGINTFGSITTEPIYFIGANTAAPPLANPDVNPEPVTEAGVYNGNDPFPDNPSSTGNLLANDSGVGITVSTSGSIQGIYGTLTVVPDGTWSYVIDNANPITNALAQGATVYDMFSYTIIDENGLTSTSTLTINITGTNDLPVASANTNTIIEDATAAVTGNMITDDDGFNVDSDPDTGAVLHVSGVNTTGANQYGTLTFNSDGSYSYAINNNNASVQALNAGESLTETYTYTLMDENGATDTAFLTITIKGADDSSTVVTANLEGPDSTVYEHGLVVPATTETTTGSFTVSSTDSIQDIVIGGSTFTLAEIQAFSTTNGSVNTGQGILTLTNYSGTAFTGTISYSYTLSATINNSTIIPTGNDTVNGTGFNDSVALTVNGLGGSTASDDLVVNIVDDVPDAIADTNLGTANENSVTLTGNVLTNDVQGADGAAVTPVTSLAGTYGSITIGADGAYTYTLNPADADFTALVGGATGTETFTYTLTDGDGDTDTAVLTLNIKNDDDSVTISNLTPKAEGGDVTVNENDLLASRGLGESAGSDSTPESTTQAGTFTITAADGVKTLTIGTLNVITAGVYVGDGTFGTTPLGNTLTITGYDSATGVVSYTYTLNDNETHAPVQGTNSLFEDLTVSLTDRDDDNTTGMLSVNIVDDVPSFTQIMQGIVANQAGILSGTHNIAFGADGEGSINLSALTQVTGLNYSTATHNLDGSTTITAGTGTSDTGFFSLTIKSDGTYDFTLIDPRPSVDKTVFFGTVSGSAGVPVLTIGSGSDQIIFTGLGGDTIKPTSAGFGVNDGNLNPGDDFSISFAGNLVDSVSFTVKHQGSGLFSMNWVTDSGETGTVSTSVDATIKVDPTSDFSSISFYTISGNAKVDSFNYSQNLLPPDQVLQFSISAIDGDGDISASQILGISLLGDAIGSPIVGTGLDESILGSNYAESIDGGAGNDIIVGGLAADTLTGGSGADTFKFAAGDSGQSTGYDTITDYAKGVDIISYTTSMVIGGNANPVTTNEASINQTTGVATFAVGSGTTLSDALNDIATRFTSATTDSAGKFALFQLAGTGNYYVFISDGVAGVTANDVVINLNGVTSITSVSLTGSTLKITPIAIDLNADGITYLNRNAGVMYDYNQDGTAESTAWVAGTDGLLAMQNKDGSLSITFSTQAGETDLQGLAKTYDVNLDGVLDQNDSSFGRFGVWQDANSDGKVEAGEFKSLTDAGIASIGLHSDGQAYTTAGGDVDVSGASTYTRTDGSSGVVEDATFAVTNQDASLTIYNSVITDTQGDNILTGTLRVDVFKWSLNDQGTAGAPANDVVTNFSIAQGDSLDLRDLLSNEHDGSLTGLDNNLSSYLHFDKVGSDTVVSISTEGKFDGSLDTSKIDQTITLTDVDLIGHFTEQQDMINDVLNKQIITVDH